jgi:hypothetical protein
MDFFQFILFYRLAIFIPIAVSNLKYFSASENFVRIPYLHLQI